MEKGKRICKICGEEYPYCTTKTDPNKFRWQDVACCPEHAEEYLRKIEEARNGNTNNAQPLQEDLVSATVPAEPQEEQSELKAELIETKEIDDERNNKIRKRRRK